MFRAECVNASLLTQIWELFQKKKKSKLREFGEKEKERGFEKKENFAKWPNALTFSKSVILGFFADRINERLFSSDGALRFRFWEKGEEAAEGDSGICWKHTHTRTHNTILMQKTCGGGGGGGCVYLHAVMSESWRKKGMRASKEKDKK